MTYFYNYYAKEYREIHRDKLLSEPATMCQSIRVEEIQICRNVLRNAFIGYREGKNVEPLKRLLGEYRAYVSGCTDAKSKDKYNVDSL